MTKIEDAHFDLFNAVLTTAGLEWGGDQVSADSCRAESETFGSTDTSSINSETAYKQDGKRSVQIVVGFPVGKLEAVMAAVDKQLEQRLGTVPNEVLLAEFRAQDKLVCH